MYAHRRLHVKQYDHEKPEDRHTVKIECGGKPVKGIQEDCISYVEEEVMYWRKANHIHAWFVDNVQNGQDDCRPYYVYEDDLSQLLEVCRKVIKASKLVEGSILLGYVWTGKGRTREEHREPGLVIKDPTVAQKLLPVREGCFFGNYEYDQYYLNEVSRTRDWIKRMLADGQFGVPGEIYYTSSW